MFIRNRVSWSLAMLALMSTGSLFQGCGSDSKSGGGTASIEVVPTSGLQTAESGPGNTATFTVVLKSAPTADVTIPISSSDTGEGTVSTAALVFTAANWNAAQTVTITGVDDDEQDGDVAYTIVLAAATSADSKYNGIDPADVSVKSIDSDTAGIRALDTANLSTTEAGGTAKFKVVLNTAPTADVTVGIVSGAADEVTAAPALLTFTTTNWNAPQEVTLTGVNDDEADGDQEVTIAAAAATSADTRYAGKMFDPFKVKNVDDDSAGFVIAPLDGLVTSEDGETATFTVKLISQPTGDVTLPLSSANPQEVTIDKQSLVFTSANWASSQTVTITGVNDDVPDGDQNWVVSTGAAASADGRYDGKNPADITGKNTDNDSPGFAFTGAGEGELMVSEDGTSDTFYVRLTTRPTGTVTVPVSVDKAAEATAAPVSLEFTIDNWNSPHPVTVTGVDDDLQDGDQTFSVVLGAAVADTGNAYAGIDPPDVAGVNEDNDSPALRVRYTPPLQTTEGGGTATFTVGLQTKPASNVIIPLSSSNTAEITVSPASLTFTPDNYGPRTVTLTGVNDDAVDGNSTVTITLGPPDVSSDPDYAVLTARTLTATNIDNDTPGVSVLFDQQPAYTTESGGQFHFWIYLNTKPTAPVTFPVTTSKPGEAHSLTASVTFTTTDWNSPKQILIEGLDDNPPVNDGDQSYNVLVGPSTSTDANYNGRSIAPVALVNRDNDTVNVRAYANLVAPNTTLITTEGGGTAQFRVGLDTRPSADVHIPVSLSSNAEGTLGLLTEIVITPDHWNAIDWKTVTGLDDNPPVADGPSTYYINFGTTSSTDPAYNGKTVADGPITVVNTDNDTAAVVYSLLGGLPLTTDESGSTSRRLDVHLQTAPAPGQVVNVPVAADPATEATINFAPSVTLVFNETNWAADQSVFIRGAADATQDGAQTFHVRIGQTTGDPVYAALPQQSITGLNYDVDTPDILVTPGTLVTDEAGGQTNFSIKLTSAPTASVSIPITSLRTSECTIVGAPLTLTFTTANWNSTQVVTVRGVDDNIADGNQACPVRIGPIASTDVRYAGRSVPNVTVTNNDNDTAGLDLVYASGGLVVTEPNTSDSFQVRLKSEPTADVLVSWVSTDTTESNSSGSITFSSPSGSGTLWSSQQTVNISARDDQVADGNISYAIRVTLTSTDPNYNGIVADIPIVTNDNDNPGVILAGLGSPVLGKYPVSVDEDTTSNYNVATFTVKLQSMPTAAVTIPIANSRTGESRITGLSDAALPPEGIVIQPADWNTALPIEVHGVPDQLVDGNQDYDVTLGAPTSTDGNYNNQSSQTRILRVTTTDNDTATILWDYVSATPAWVTTEDQLGASKTIKFRLSSRPANGTTVTLPVAITNNPAEATLTGGPIVFTTSDWNDPNAHVLSIKGADDAIDDGNQAYDVTFGPSTSTDPNFVGLGPNTSGAVTLTARNDDDDTAGIIRTWAATPVSSNLFEGKGYHVATVKLTSQPTSAVTIRAILGSTGGADPTAAALSLTGAPGSYTATQDITIQPTDWNTPVSLYVQGIDDGLRQAGSPFGSRGISIEFPTGTITSSDPNYNNWAGLTPIPATVIDVAESCKATQDLWRNSSPGTLSGRRWIDTDLDPDTSGALTYCDFVTDGGGWTLLAWSENTNSAGGVPYPGTDSVYCAPATSGATGCAARGTALPQAALGPLFAISREFGVGQSTITSETANTQLGQYDFAGSYDYGANGLAGLTLEYSAPNTCTQRATAGVYNDIVGTPSIDGTVVHLAEGLRTPVGGNGGNYGAITNTYTWGVGSPVNACTIQGASPVSYLGTWQNPQYGPQALGAVGSWSVWIR